MANNQDIHDSAKDNAALKPQTTIIDLPDVEDIPGQEHVKVPQFREFADVTAASDGEEGTAVFDNDDSEVTDTERAMLSAGANRTPGDEDEADVRAMALDQTDEDGTPLNEGNLRTDRFGEDLDLPESEEVDEEE